LWGRLQQLSVLSHIDWNKHSCLFVSMLIVKNFLIYVTDVGENRLECLFVAFFQASLIISRKYVTPKCSIFNQTWPKPTLQLILSLCQCNKSISLTMTMACQNKLECLSLESFSGHLNVALYLTLVKNKQSSLFCLQALLTDNRCIRKNFQGQTHECIYFLWRRRKFL
jgi:hypothetical protein